jgi:hypothetical protein
MTRNDANTKGNEMVAKLQAFADTLDINEATIKEVEGGVFLEFRRHGEDCGRFRYLGLATDGIRKIKAAMKEVEASL